MNFRILLALLTFNLALNVHGGTSDMGSTPAAQTTEQPGSNTLAAPPQAKSVPPLRVTLITGQGTTNSPEIDCGDADDLTFYWDRPVSGVDSTLMENPAAFQQWYSANCSVTSVNLAGEMAH